MNVEIKANTNGKGLWSEEARLVIINEIKIGYSNQEYFPGEPFYGELKAYFDPSGYTLGAWNIAGFGLIYTDKLWLREFKKGLRELGLSQKAVQDLHYSEQGMQKENCVSLDIGATFYASWKRLHKKLGLPL